MDMNCFSGGLTPPPIDLTLDVCYKLGNDILPGKKNVKTVAGLTTVTFYDAAGAVVVGAKEVVCPPPVMSVCCGAAADVDLGTVDSISLGDPPVVVDALVPTAVVGVDDYLLGKPAAWGKVTVQTAAGPQDFVMALYTPV